MITNNAEGKPKKNPAASWVFLVTDYIMNSCHQEFGVSWVKIPVRCAYNSDPRKVSVFGYLGFIPTKCSALKRRRWLVQKCFSCQPPNTKASKTGRQFGISYPSATPGPLSHTSSQYASMQVGKGICST